MTDIEQLLAREAIRETCQLDGGMWRIAALRLARQHKTIVPRP